MKISVHVWTSAFLAAILYPIFNWKVAFIAVGGVIFDADHYLWYICKYRRFSLSECYRKFGIEGPKTKWREFEGTILLFHNVEFWLLMLILSFYSQIAMLISIGLLLHNSLDIIWHASVPKRLIIDYSVLHWALKRLTQKFK